MNAPQRLFSTKVSGFVQGEKFRTVRQEGISTQRVLSQKSSPEFTMSILSSFIPSFKEVVTSRGFKYTYYFSAPTPDKPTLLFIHGFPSVALDWHHQIAHFRQKGYGLVVPNQLGYGGSDKPAEIKDYVQDLIAKDMVDILDHEKVANVISIGHDWCVDLGVPSEESFPDRQPAVGAAIRRAFLRICTRIAS